MDKKSFPEGWKVMQLGEVCTTTSGGTPNRKNKSYFEGKIPWVKSGELDKGLILDTEEKITEEAIANSSAKIFPKGTLLIALYGATIGKLSFLGIDAATNQAVCGIFKSDAIEPQFLYYYLIFQKRSLIKQAIGGAQPNISQGILKSLPIPLPPLAEQQQIVAKIEALFSELDAGKQEAEKALAQLKVYRQAVLKWAFEGRLTDAVEKIKLTRFGDIIESVSGNTPKGLDSVSNEGDIQFYKVSDMNLEGNEIEMRSSKLALTKEEIKDLKIKTYPAGTVIFPKRGGAILTNKKRILATRSAFDLNLMGALPNSAVDGKYLFHWFSKLDLSKIYDGSNVPQINNKNIHPLEFPLCPLEEQHRIVQEIEARLSVCDEIESTIAASLQQAEALRQSILKKAFEGKLL